MSVKPRGGVYHYSFRLNGHRYRETTEIKVGGPKQKRLAENVEACIRADILAGKDVTLQAKLTLYQYAEKYFVPWVEDSGKADKTQLDYKNGWRLLRDSRIAKVRICDISKADAETLRITGSNYNANCALRTLRRILGLAEDRGVITRAPKIPLRQVEGRKGVYDQLTTDRIIAAAPQPLRDVFIMTRDGGLRNGREALQMRWEHVNWAERIYFVYGSKSNRGKRKIVITERMMGVLLARRKGQTEGWVFPNDKTESGHHTIWHIDHQFAKVRKELGLDPKAVIYTGRRSAGTDAMKKMKDPFAVMQFMGHSNVATTAIYQEPDYLSMMRDDSGGPQKWPQ